MNEEIPKMAISDYLTEFDRILREDDPKRCYRFGTKIFVIILNYCSGIIILAV